MTGVAVKLGETCYDTPVVAFTDEFFETATTRYCAACINVDILGRHSMDVKEGRWVSRALGECVSIITY